MYLDGTLVERSSMEADPISFTQLPAEPEENTSVPEGSDFTRSATSRDGQNEEHVHRTTSPSAE